MSFEEFGIYITSTGKEVRTTCPQCSAGRKNSKDKCLAVNTDEGCWFCHHCSWSGGLGGKNYKPVPYEEKTALPDALIKYFDNRGIPESILEQERIGFKSEYGKNWIMFPYFKNSVCVNIKFKTWSKDFRQVKDGRKILYRYDKIMQTSEKTLIITEGEIDALSCLVAGFEATSMPDGAPSANSKSFQTKFDFLKDTEKLFEKFDKIIIAGDNDAPGQLAISELTRRIGVERCHLVTYPEGCKDTNDVLKKHGKDRLSAVLKAAKPCPIAGVFSPLDLKDLVMSDFDNGVSGGIRTGWSQLDELYTVRPGEMTILTGIPGSGKSNFLDALCVNLMQEEAWKFGVFSPENWPPQRHLATLSEKLSEASFAESQYGKRMSRVQLSESIDVLDDYFRFIMPDEDEPLTVDNILSHARKLCFQFGIKGLVIDPWNEIEHNFGNLTETQYIARELGKIRKFARFNGIHIWVVAHPTKMQKGTDGKYPPPTLYDIAGGAHWRNKADNGLCVHRDYDNNTTSVFVQKIRFREIGKIGTMNLKFTYSGNYKQV